MLHTLSVSTFPRPLFQDRLLYEVDIPEVGKLRSLYGFIDQIKRQGVRPHVCVLSSDRPEKQYIAFSDHAAFLYKRKGQIVWRADGCIQWNGGVFVLGSPDRIKVYPLFDLDCKTVRKQTWLRRRGKVKIVEEEDE